VGCGNNGLDDGHVLVAYQQIMDKGAVDFYRIDGKELEIVEG
jgi:hypothetical protein